MMAFKFMCIVLAVGVTCIGTACGQQNETANKTIRIGVFDSRGVAVAYGRSDAFREHIVDMKRTHKEATEAGNMHLADSLESLGVSLQDQLHKQVFGNAPIPEIMEDLKDVLPGIANEANVDIILNKWAIPYQNEKVAMVDITLKIAEHYNPTEETKTIINRLKDTPPVPVDELQHDH